MKGYFFGDPGMDLPREPQPVIDTKLDDDGRLAQALDLLSGAEAPKAPYEVIVSGSVFESGGRAVRRSLLRTVWPADALVGVRPLFDPADGADANSEARFEIVKADADGTPVATDHLTVKLVRELRDYHWTWVDGSGWNTDFTRRHETVAETALRYDGKTPVEFSARVEWGEYRLEVADPATGLTMRYPFTAGWSWNDDNRGLDARPDKVKVAFDKTGYRAGDTAIVTLTAPWDGPGVVLVESDHLLHRTNVQVRGPTEVKIPVGADFNRHDVYVTALVFRPADQANLTGPGRALGVAHLPPARDTRDAGVELEAPPITRPDSPSWQRFRHRISPARTPG